jgi:hypothetical protein
VVTTGLGAQENLARGIPADALFFFHWRSAPRSGFADTYLGRMRQSLRASGFMDEYLQVLGDSIPAERKRSFGEEAAYWERILGEMRWWRLLSRQVAIGGRVDRVGRLEWIFLFETGKTQRDAILDSCREILYGLCALGGDYELEIADREGIPATVLYNLLDPAEQICAAGEGSTVALGTSASLVRRSFQLLAGEGSGLSLVDSERYRQERRALEEARGGGASIDRERAGLEILIQPASFLEEWPQLDVLETFHLAARFGADRIQCDYRLLLKGESESPLLAALSSQAPVKDLVRQVPAGVAGFEVSAGCDPSRLYEFLLAILEPLAGADLAASLEKDPGSDGFGVREDLLRHLSGRRTVMVFPPGGQEPGADGGGSREERAYLFELETPGKGRDVLAEKLAGLAALVRKWGLEVQETEVEGVPGACYSVGLGVVPGIRLEVAVTERELALATSREALERAVRSREGAGQSILDNPEISELFPELWKEPAGDLDGALYGGFAGRLAVARGLLNAAGILGKLLPTDDKRGLFVFRPLLAALPRLRGAIEALDFLDKMYGYTVRDGRAYYGHRVILLHRVKRV